MTAETDQLPKLICMLLQSHKIKRKYSDKYRSFLKMSERHEKVSYPIVKQKGA